VQFEPRAKSRDRIHIRELTHEVILAFSWGPRQVHVPSGTLSLSEANLNPLDPTIVRWLGAGVGASEVLPLRARSRAARERVR
jgi:hypothetical protein